METTRLAQLQEYLAQSPEDAFLRYAVALEFVKLERDSEAAEAFARLLREQPAYLPTYYHYGHALLRLGHREQAAQTWLAGLEVAKAANDGHTAAELRFALEELDSERFGDLT